MTARFRNLVLFSLMHVVFIGDLLAENENVTTLQLTMNSSSFGRLAGTVQNAMESTSVGVSDNENFTAMVAALELQQILNLPEVHATKLEDQLGSFMKKLTLQIQTLERTDRQSYPLILEKYLFLIICSFNDVILNQPDALVRITLQQILLVQNEILKHWPSFKIPEHVIFAIQEAFTLRHDGKHPKHIVSDLDSLLSLRTDENVLAKAAATFIESADRNYFYHKKQTHLSATLQQWLVHCHYEPALAIAVIHAVTNNPIEQFRYLALARRRFSDSHNDPSRALVIERQMEISAKKAVLQNPKLVTITKQLFRKMAGLVSRTQNCMYQLGQMAK